MARLVARLHRKEKQWHDANDRLDGAESDARREHPVPPTKQRLAALRAHKAACRKVERRFNVPALKAAEKAARRALEAKEDAIAERPAHSMVGFAVKLAKWVRYDGSSPMLGATLDDAPGPNRPVIMAYRDAARLAGLPEDMYAEGES
jgi:hypothetical protein